MMSRVVHGADQQRTFAAILETGDEVMSCLLGLTAEEGITGAAVNGIGAFSAATLAYFDWGEKRYVNKVFEEQLEVASLSGDIGVDEEGNRRPTFTLYWDVGPSTRSRAVWSADRSVRRSS